MIDLTYPSLLICSIVCSWVSKDINSRGLEIWLNIICDSMHFISRPRFLVLFFIFLARANSMVAYLLNFITINARVRMCMSFVCLKNTMLICYHLDLHERGERLEMNAPTKPNLPSVAIWKHLTFDSAESIGRSDLV